MAARIQNRLATKHLLPVLGEIETATLGQSEFRLSCLGFKSRRFTIKRAEPKALNSRAAQHPENLTTAATEGQQAVGLEVCRRVFLSRAL